MRYKQRWTAVAVATAMVVGMTIVTPSTTADHVCGLTVNVADSHAPADDWTQHDHPLFTQSGHCRVDWFEVDPSWDESFTTVLWNYHPTLPSGEYNVEVQAHWNRDHQHVNSFLHCHIEFFGTCLEWHWHTVESVHVHHEVTPWMQSPTVKIDITPPTTEISNISEPHVDGTYVTNETVIHIDGNDAHSGVAAVEYQSDNGSWQPASNGTRIEGEDGSYDLSYRAVDNVGLITEQTSQFILDNTGPVGEMVHPQNNSVSLGEHRIETCGDDALITPGAIVDDLCEGQVTTTPGQNVTFTPVIVVQGVVEIAANFTDESVGTNNVEFIVDDRVLDDQPGGDGQFTFTWDTTGHSAGNHNVTLRAFDRLGNEDQIDFVATVIPGLS